MHVRLLKPLKNKTVRYEAELLQQNDTCVLLLATWNAGRVDLGYLSFEDGDQLYEYFYSDRWYNIYDVRDAAGERKGWYCNLTRPARFERDAVESEDLEIDVFVSADRRTILTLDEDEYQSRGLQHSEPASHQAVLAALAELQDLAARGYEMFGVPDGEMPTL
jgi:hypothetical protein